jgi:hypothetical protein
MRGGAEDSRIASPDRDDDREAAGGDHAGEVERRWTATRNTSSARGR